MEKKHKKARFHLYCDPDIIVRLKVEARKQRRSAASLTEYILDQNLPKDNSVGNPGEEPTGKADR